MSRQGVDHNGTISDEEGRRKMIGCCESAAGSYSLPARRGLQFGGRIIASARLEARLPQHLSQRGFPTRPVLLAHHTPGPIDDHVLRKTLRDKNGREVSVLHQHDLGLTRVL